MVGSRAVAQTICGFVTAMLLGACTSITVQPLDASLSPTRVCIQENPKVEVTDFLEVVQAGFDRHGIATEVYGADLPDTCELVLTYTALRSWDLTTFLSHAELYLSRDGQVVASAEYHLRAKGGYSLKKYQGTKQKIDPVIDKLLASY